MCAKIARDLASLDVGGTHGEPSPKAKQLETVIGTGFDALAAADTGCKKFFSLPRTRRAEGDRATPSKMGAYKSGAPP